MRRFIIGALTVLGTLTLVAAPATAQYVRPPGDTPTVSGAGFGAQSAEVRGESVTRDDSAGVAGIAGQPAAVESAEVARVGGVEASRSEAVESAREVGTSRSGSARSGGSLLALTGISVAALALGGAALVGIGAILRRFGRPQTV